MSRSPPSSAGLPPLPAAAPPRHQAPATLQGHDGAVPSAAELQAARQAQISGSAIPVLAACLDAAAAAQLQQLWPASPDGLALPLGALQLVADSCPVGGGSGGGSTQASVCGILAALAASGSSSGSSSSSLGGAADGASGAAAAAPGGPVAPGDGSSIRLLLSGARERLLAEEKELLARVRTWPPAAWPGGLPGRRAGL
jgi:hypothetical protein